METAETPAAEDKPIHFRISSPLFDRARVLAKAEQRSLSNFFRLLISEGVEQRERGERPVEEQEP